MDGCLSQTSVCAIVGWICEWRKTDCCSENEWSFPVWTLLIQKYQDAVHCAISLIIEIFFLSHLPTLIWLELNWWRAAPGTKRLETKLLVSLRNRTAERRGRQNAWAWRTWQGYNLRISSWSWLTSMFSGLLQKDLFKRKWRFGKKLFQAKLLSRLSHKVCRLLSSPVLLRKFTNITRRHLCSLLGVAPKVW